MAFNPFAPVGQFFQGIGATFNPPKASTGPIPSYGSGVAPAWTQQPTSKNPIITSAGKFPNYAAYQQANILGASTTGAPGGVSTPTSNQQQFNIPQISEPSGPDENALRAIEEDYNTTIGAIGAQETQLQSQLPTAISGVEKEQKQKETALGTERTSRLGQITTREGEQERATQGALEQLRNLYQEVGRKQQAQLSAGGITSSSAGEALATLLGRDMAQRVAGEFATREGVLNNLATERKNVEDYFSTTISSLQQETADRISQARNQFNQALAQLTQLRGAASVEKQRGRANLYQQFQSQITAIQQANQQAQLALQTWQAQMNTRLQAAQQSSLNLPSPQTNPLNIGTAPIAFSPGQPVAPGRAQGFGGAPGGVQSPLSADVFSLINPQVNPPVA